MCRVWHAHSQLDVSAAFLQADLEEEIYVRAPRGFEGHVKEGEVLKVRRGLYGLKQGSSSWYRAISEYLTGKRSNEAEVPEEQAQDAAASNPMQIHRRGDLLLDMLS